MKISIITTVLNEEKNIESLLESLENQSLKPDEVIIVDGGSRDKTLRKIIKFQKSSKLKIKVIKSISNRAEGRNIAIENSSGHVIVATDAGCIPDKDWIKNLIKGFDKKIDVVAGYYLPVANSAFEKSLATYTSVMPDQVKPSEFLPSSRSIAFKKEAWEKVGGYPNWLNTCEDLYFARQLKRKKFKFVFAKNAIVRWPQRKNLGEAIGQFFSYAVGDGMARYIRPNTPLLFGRYFIGVVLLIIFFQTKSILLFALIWTLLINYILWAIMKNYFYAKSKLAIFWLPVLQFSSDITVLAGTTYGFIKGFVTRRK